MAGLVRQHTGYRKKLMGAQSAPKALFGEVPQSARSTSLRRDAGQKAELLWMLKQLLLSPIAIVLGIAAFIAGRMSSKVLLGSEGLMPLAQGAPIWWPLVAVAIGAMLALGCAVVLGWHRGLPGIAMFLGFAAAFWYEPMFIGQMSAVFEGVYPISSARSDLLRL